eukprot:CAMPEP_0185737692 /NCGR_PEP_ID=MMETSP1171-20130828/31029_1 /TAXON_ID=374046 /ORGANISM="Helicotheca tamensis, Strain CCMP826" /LENGTH=284 /DNA_ID=CAMNT_0028408683 /DNA_START=71 /DNA_END=925 /DNA_ORIENTATION=-
MNQMNASPPRKRRSAYNLFFACERELILSNLCPSSDEKFGAEEERNGSHPLALKDAMSHPMLPTRYHNIDLTNPIVAFNINPRKHCRAHGKIDLVNLCQEISKRWRDADKETRAYFHALSKQDLLRYKKEMAMYTNTITSNEKEYEASESAVPVMASGKGTRKRMALESPSNRAANRSTKRYLVQNDVGNECDLSGYTARGVNIIPPNEYEDTEIAKAKRLAKQQAASLSQLAMGNDIIPSQVSHWVPQEQVSVESTFTWEQYLDLYKVYLDTLLTKANPSLVP